MTATIDPDGAVEDGVAADRGRDVGVRPPRSRPVVPAETGGGPRPKRRPPGTRVRTATGRALVDPTGRFLVAGEPGDEVVVDADPPGGRSCRRPAP